MAGIAIDHPERRQIGECSELLIAVMRFTFLERFVQIARTQGKHEGHEEHPAHDFPGAGF